jgi:small subunit ribosomal protein S4
LGLFWFEEVTMARYIGPVCKLCRREGTKLYLKGERCYSEKCAYTRRPYPPGQHGQGRIKLSEYAVRLREKQKVRRVYGVLERQFRGYFQEASRRKGRTGEEMLALLERRLDSVVYRLGFASSRAESRQLVMHGHVKVNGKRLDIPSYIARLGDKVELNDNARKFKFVLASIAGADKRPNASWLEIDRPNFTGTVKTGPVREDLNEPEIREQLIVEYYSR